MKISAAVLVAVLALAGCGGSAVAPSSAASSNSAPAAPGFVNGTVKSVAADQLVLADGQTFTTSASTRYTRLQKIQPSALKPGEFAAITAKSQSDGSLLASDVRVSEGSGQKGGQFPLSGGNLMTNAPIKQVQADAMTVTLPGGDAQVKFAPNMTLELQSSGTAADVQPGKMVLVVGRDKTAAAISVEM